MTEIWPQVAKLRTHIAWLGETGRMGFWRSDALSAEGGGAMLAHLLPRTGSWAALQVAWSCAALAVVLDEGDRLTQQGGPERQKSWDVLRHLEYGALHQRLGVEFREGEPDDLHQKQIRLPSFDKARLVDVARRVREIYPAEHPERVAARVNDRLLDAMTSQVTSGFGGSIAVVPRVFLREWVRQLGLVDQNADYDPAARYKFEISKVSDLSPEEKVAAGIASAVSTEVEPQVF